MTDPLNQRLRQLPSVDELLRHPLLQRALETGGRDALVRAARHAVDRARESIRRGEAAEAGPDQVLQALAEQSARSLRPVINATGVVLHTNLGRAPLAESALQAAVDVGRGYSNLEFNLREGGRGSRYDHARERARALFHCEDALVVNNGAAAVLLVLSSLAAGRGAVVSRGELVEIGGGFRIPEVITQGGAHLVEVGTTNRTRLSDYENALGPGVAVILKVHRSNFAVVGFTAEAGVPELAQLARARGLPLVVDLGTGRIQDDAPPDPSEPTVAQVLAQGADVVIASGDKLLGGPQAGLILGRADLVAACRTHPLCRALRVDKLTLAALEETLRLHHDGRSDQVPAVAMLRAGALALKERAERVRAALAAHGVHAEPVEATGRPGGGTLPLVELRTHALALVSPDGADALAARLRAADPPVVARVLDGRVLVDLRCVAPREEEGLCAAIRQASAGHGMMGGGAPRGAGEES